MNKEALNVTLESGNIFYSRTKQRLWTKAKPQATSKISQYLSDCDNDFLILAI